MTSFSGGLIAKVRGEVRIFNFGNHFHGLEMKVIRLFGRLQAKIIIGGILILKGVFEIQIKLKEQTTSAFLFEFVLLVLTAFVRSCSLNLLCAPGSKW